MIDDFFAWLPGNTVIDPAAIVGTFVRADARVGFPAVDAPELVKPVAAPAGHRSEYERIIAESGKAGDF
jgi:hypothetical protein